MKAVVISQPGTPGALEAREAPTPEARGERVLIRVRACGVNRADLLQARGRYPAPPGVPPDIPGLEYAGEVEALGPDCIGPLKVGDRVFGILGGGGFAEAVVSHERMVVPIPDGLNFEEAAAVPEAFLTAHDALETLGELRPGQSVLIQAATGGVGLAAIQIAHTMGCTVFGTSRTAEKLERAAGLKLGLDIGIDSTQEDFAEVIRRHTAGAGVQVVMDHLGGPVLAGNLEALAPLGRLVVVGLLAGARTEFDLATLLRKRATIIGTTLRARPLEEKIEATRRFAERVGPWLARGLVRPVIDRVYPLDDVRAAQERVESNLGFGKVILRP